MQTIVAVFQPATRRAASPDGWTAMIVTTVTPIAAPTYRLVLLMPLPVPARTAGTLATASRPRLALTTPVPRPATTNPPTNCQSAEVVVRKVKGMSPMAITTSPTAILVPPDTL